MNMMLAMVVLCAGAVACAQTEQPVVPAAGTPAAVPAVTPQKVGEFATADDLLKALETADTDLKSLTSELLWTKEFFLGGDTHTRKGKLAFVDARRAVAAKAGEKPVEKSKEGTAEAVKPEGRRQFAVTIEATEIKGGGNNDSARLERDTVEWVFNGFDLVERRFGEKMVVRHTMGNAKADPLKIGEGPIPLPVGQRREDILARFTVELLPPEKDLVGADEDTKDAAVVMRTQVAKDCVQLKLIPKPEHARECSFKEARLWYRRSGVDGKEGRLLPRMARAVNKQDDVDTVMLINVQVNTDVARVFDASVPEGWQEQVLGGGN